jgi:hypothetical protein
MKTKFLSERVEKVVSRRTLVRAEREQRLIDANSVIQGVNSSFLNFKNDVLGNEYIINSIKDAEELHENLIKLNRKLYFNGILDFMPHYRGEQNYGWDINNGIFRPPLKFDSVESGKVLEKLAIEEFYFHITNNLGGSALRKINEKYTYSKDWDLLFQAQHAGIKTTLTDWSAKIKISLFFATEESLDSIIDKSDGQLWVFLTPKINLVSDIELYNEPLYYDINPFELDRTFLINPSYSGDILYKRIFEYRMMRQIGRFLICSKETCNIPLNKQKDFENLILRYRIPYDSKIKIRKELKDCGITRSDLYVEEPKNVKKIIESINNKFFS